MDHSAHGEHIGHGNGEHHDMNHEENLGSTVVSTMASTLNNMMHAQKSMDHSMEGHDHSMDDDMNHGGHAGMDHNMKMWFHTGYSEVILFENWKINSIEGLIGSMVGIFLMATLYEGLKYYRQYLYWKTYNAVQYRSVTIPTEKGVVTEDNQIVHMVGEMIHKQPPTLFSWMHAFQASLHLIQIVLSYFLMLIFMTYNVWLCMAVVLGAVLGYFLFGWKKPIVVDVAEHCH